MMEEFHWSRLGHFDKCVSICVPNNRKVGRYVFLQKKVSGYAYFNLRTLHKLVCFGKSYQRKRLYCSFQPCFAKKDKSEASAKKNPENANMYTRLICAFYYYVSLLLSYFSKIAYSKTSVHHIIWNQKLKLILTEASIMVCTY